MNHPNEGSAKHDDGTGDVERGEPEQDSEKRPRKPLGVPKERRVKMNGPGQPAADVVGLVQLLQGSRARFGV